MFDWAGKVCSQKSSLSFFGFYIGSAILFAAIPKPHLYLFLFSIQLKSAIHWCQGPNCSNIFIGSLYKVSSPPTLCCVLLHVLSSAKKFYLSYRSPLLHDYHYRFLACCPMRAKETCDVPCPFLPCWSWDITWSKTHAYYSGHYFTSWRPDMISCHTGWLRRWKI